MPSSVVPFVALQKWIHSWLLLFVKSNWQVSIGYFLNWGEPSLGHFIFVSFQGTSLNNNPIFIHFPWKLMDNSDKYSNFWMIVSIDWINQALPPQLYCWTLLNLFIWPWPWREPSPLSLNLHSTWLQILFHFNILPFHEWQYIVHINGRHTRHQLRNLTRGNFNNSEVQQLHVPDSTSYCW